MRVHPEAEIHRQINIQLEKKLAEKYKRLRQQREASNIHHASKIRKKKRRDLALPNKDESLQKSKKLVTATKENLEIAKKNNSGLR